MLSVLIQAETATMNDPTLFYAGVGVTLFAVCCVTVAAYFLLGREQNIDTGLYGFLGELEQAGVRDVNVKMLAEHRDAGGHLESVVKAMLLVHEHDLPLTWRMLCGFDLSQEAPVALAEKMITPWKIPIPGLKQLHGKPIAAIAQDGVELLVRGEALVRGRPDVSVTQTPELLVALIGEKIMAGIGQWDNHVDLIKDSLPIVNIVTASRETYLRSGLELVEFRITQVERGRDLVADAAEATKPGEAERKRDEVRRNLKNALMEKQADQMDIDQLLELASSYADAGDVKMQRQTCTLAIRKAPTDEGVNQAMYRALIANDAPNHELLAFANRCIEKEIQPLAVWHTVRAALLCRVITANDPTTARPHIEDNEKYERAIASLETAMDLEPELLAANDQIHEMIDWISDFGVMQDDPRYIELSRRRAAARSVNDCSDIAAPQPGTIISSMM